MNRSKTRLRNEAVVARAAAGERIADLACEYDLTTPYIYLLVRKAGAQLPAGRAGGGKSDRVVRRRAIIAELHGLGLSGGAVIRLLGISRMSFYQDARKCGLKFPYDASRWLVGGRSSQQRAARMAAMYRSGMTLQQIGDKYGISRERVRQLMTKHEGMRQDGGGQHVKAVARRQQSDATKDVRYLSRYGCTFAQYVEVREVMRKMRARGAGIFQTPVMAFNSQRNNAKYRGIPWGLTFWQWWTIWQESGKWDQRGRAKHAYVMSRFGDQGSYEVGNIYIGTLSENSSIQPNNPHRKDHPDHDKVTQKNSRVARGCTVEGCGSKHYAHGYCNNHYYHFVTKARASSERAAA